MFRKDKSWVKASSTNANMAPMKSIITPIEKNPDGTVKQKAIITGAIPKQSKFQPKMQSQKPVTYGNC